MKKSTDKKVALVLSGGGSRGAYQAGAWQALQELGVHVDLVTGTSVGAINAALIAQEDSELAVSLWKEMETHMVFDVPEGSQPFDYAKEIVIHQGAGTSGLKKLMDQYIREEKIRRSPYDLGITAVSMPGFRPHYLYKENIPEGKLIDFIMASASAYPAIHSYPIDGVEYIDGGYADGIPVKMALDRGATHVIVVNLRGYGRINKEAIESAPDLKWIESPWDLGFQFIFDTDNTRFLIRLGYLDTMKAYGVLEGNYYTFCRCCFDKSTLKAADACARIFDMNPSVIYTREIFLETLADIINNSRSEAEEALEKYRSIPKGLAEAKLLFKEIKNIANQHVLTFLVAYNIKEHGKESIFLSRAAQKILPEHIAAAKFLIKYNLL